MMIKNALRVLLASLLIVMSPLATMSAAAQATSANINVARATVTNAVQKAISQTPDYRKLTTQQKMAILQAAVSSALATANISNQSDIVAILTTLVRDNVIPSIVAVSVANQVSPDVGKAVAINRWVAPGLPTASTDTNTSQSVSVLTSLQNNSNGNTGVGSNTLATYDPCAGVIAAYCGN